MQEPWFALLCERTTVPGVTRTHVARLLGISGATLSQVLNGSGLYGTGVADTGRIADRVAHTFGRYACPHLSAQTAGDEQVITAAQCRAFAHRPAPTASPRDIQHWQACRTCAHREASAPPVPREVIPRKKEKGHEL